MNLVSSGGERVVVIMRNCRTVTISREPYSLAGSLDKLGDAGIGVARADFMWRSYRSEECLAVWRALRAGRRIHGVRKLNYFRGLL